MTCPPDSKSNPHHHLALMQSVDEIEILLPRKDIRSKRGHQSQDKTRTHDTI